MKKMSFVLLIITLFVCISPMSAQAAEGTIRMKLPKEMEGAQVFYQKDDVQRTAVVERDGNVIISQLPVGEYQIRISDTEEYEFQPIELRVPTWSTEEERMLYDITVEPKFSKKGISPQTGDQTSPAFYVALGGICLSVAMMCILMARKKDKSK